MFIASISLLHKILNACQNLIHGIVAYTFLNVCEKKSTQFRSGIKKDAHRRKLVPFFCLAVYIKSWKKKTIPMYMVYDMYGVYKQSNSRVETVNWSLSLMYSLLPRWTLWPAKFSVRGVTADAPITAPWSSRSHGAIVRHLRSIVGRFVNLRWCPAGRFVYRTREGRAA